MSKRKEQVMKPAVLFRHLGNPHCLEAFYNGHTYTVWLTSECWVYAVSTAVSGSWRSRPTRRTLDMYGPVYGVIARAWVRERAHALAFAREFGGKAKMATTETATHADA